MTSVADGPKNCLKKFYFFTKKNRPTPDFFEMFCGYMILDEKKLSTPRGAFEEKKCTKCTPDLTTSRRLYLSRII
jgi:hypothetical protein